MEHRQKNICQSVPKEGGEGKTEKQERLLQGFLRYAQTQKVKQKGNLILLPFLQVKFCQNNVIIGVHSLTIFEMRLNLL